MRALPLLLLLTLSACGPGETSSGVPPQDTFATYVVEQCANLSKQCRFGAPTESCLVVKQTPEAANTDANFYNAFCGAEND